MVLFLKRPFSHYYAALGLPQYVCGCFQNSITLDRKIILTSGFHQFVAHTVLLQSGILTPHVKIVT